MMYKAIVKFDYSPPSRYIKGRSFGKNEYNRYKKRSDRSEIVASSYSPFPSFCGAVEDKKAVFYFETNEKFISFMKYLEELENKGEFFGRCTEENVEA